MKPLVYYCRWQGATLRLRGRDEAAVWGQFVFAQDDGSEKTQNFRFELATAVLHLYDGAEEQSIQLDEMGIVQKN